MRASKARKPAIFRRVRRVIRNTYGIPNPQDAMILNNRVPPPKGPVTKSGWVLPPGAILD